MTSSTASSGAHAAQSLSPSQVREFREKALANGYEVCAVRSGEKAPAHSNWQRGTPRHALLNIHNGALNSGVLASGLRAIDLDIDDRDIRDAVLKAWKPHLPSKCLVKTRSNSPRVTLVYRAASGTPKKRAVGSNSAKIEILGDGQQLLAHGLHPSGVMVEWRNGRSPATVPVSELDAISEEQVGHFLELVRPLLGAIDTFARPPGEETLDTEAANAELAGGIGSPHWFGELPSQQKNELVRACFKALDNSNEDPRDAWRDALFAAADAEIQGAAESRALALEWSMRGAGWTTDKAFDVVWSSFKPSGGITVATLLCMAKKRGLDLSPWRAKTDAPSEEREQQAMPPRATLEFSPLAIGDLPVVPPKREWLHGVDVIRGAVSLVVAPGGRGKTAWLVGLALACATGRWLLGAKVFGGPLRVLYINAEDSTSEINRRVRAAMIHHGLRNPDLEGLRIAGVDTGRLTLLRTLKGEPKINDVDVARLEAIIADSRSDVLIMDPLANLSTHTLNDNTGATMLMACLTSLATKYRMGIVLAHHASKGRDIASQEAALGASAIVNSARIALSLEALSDSEAARLGIPPWHCASVFRLISTKANLAPPAAEDRCFRLISVQLPNAAPPCYPEGDKVQVVEPFSLKTLATAFDPSMLAAVLNAIRQSNPPLSPSPRAQQRNALPVIVAAMAPYRDGRATESDAKAVLEHLKKTGRVTECSMPIRRASGKGADVRHALVAIGPDGMTGTGGSPQHTATSRNPDTS